MLQINMFQLALGKYTWQINTGPVLKGQIPAAATKSSFPSLALTFDLLIQKSKEVLLWP